MRNNDRYFFATFQIGTFSFNHATHNWNKQIFDFKEKILELKKNILTNLSFQEKIFIFYINPKIFCFYQKKVTESNYISLLFVSLQTLATISLQLLHRKKVTVIATN